MKRQKIQKKLCELHGDLEGLRAYIQIREKLEGQERVLLKMRISNILEDISRLARKISD